jgi:uncharacterized protein YaaN involved in tellurite resistance
MNNIEILEEFIDKVDIYLNDDIGDCAITSKIAGIIKNLIQENKELEKKNKKWEELYDEDQEYITQLNNKIFQLETDNKKLDKENQGLMEDKSDDLKNRYLEITINNKTFKIKNDVKKIKYTDFENNQFTLEILEKWN